MYVCDTSPLNQDRLFVIRDSQVYFNVPLLCATINDATLLGNDTVIKNDE